MPDILDDSYESDLTDEEHERLVLMSEHAWAIKSPGIGNRIVNANTWEALHHS